MKFFKSMELSKKSLIKWNTRIFCIRIVPSSGTGNFKRNPHFSDIFRQLLSFWIQQYEENTSCIHILQYSNHIIIAFNISDASRDKRNRLFFHDILTSFKTVIAQINTELAKEPFSFILKAFFAVDQGTITLEESFLGHPLFGNYIWLGETIERAVALSDIAGTGNFLPLLITHEIYKELNPKLKKDFSKNYYHQHICCYGSAYF